MNEHPIDEDARQRFKSAWMKGNPEAIEQCLPPPGHPSYLGTLEELVLIELEFAWKSRQQPGETIAQDAPPQEPFVEDYLERFPELQQQEIVLRLLRQEFEVRRRYADRPSVDEYRARFPCWIVTGRELSDERHAIEQVDDSDVRHTVSSLPPAGGHVLIETLQAPTQSRARYTLSRLHAEGGLGRVWVARDSDLNREVALKELKPQRSAHPDAWRRFLKEAQVTGQLEHPNIVPVYELGRRPEDDQPFYTMRFVRGQTLRAAVAEYHQQRRSGKVDPLAQPRLLRAFVSVCNAISFAHSRGVVHRDLKPDNVVLGGFGEVLLLDWGLAKLGEKEEEQQASIAVSGTAAAQATAEGHVMGTPAYMAPEQAEGDTDKIGTRTDVYGLGAILFEILTSKPPHSGENTSELLQQIINKPTPRARQAEPSVPLPLDAICAKAMAKQRGERYQSAHELADDIERFLADEPVTVYREPLSGRIARWVRRHRTWAQAAAAAVLLVAIVSSVAAVLVNRAWRNESKARSVAQANLVEAQHQKQQAQRHQDRAEKNFAMALEAVNTYLTKVSEDERLRTHGLEQLRRDLLESARKFYEQFVEQQGDDLALQAEKVRAYSRLGRITSELGDKQEALTLYNTALPIAQQLYKDHADDINYRWELAVVFDGVGHVYYQLGQLAEAEASLKQAAKTYKQLAHEQADMPGYQSAVAAAETTLGVLYQTAGRFEEALAAHNAALQINTRLVQQYPDYDYYRSQLALSQSNLGGVHYKRLRMKEAEPMQKAAVETYRQLVETHPDEPWYQSSLAYAQNGLGESYRCFMQLDQAETAFRQALAICQELVRRHPDVPDYRNHLARCHVNLGFLCTNVGRNAEAEENYNAARDIYQVLIPDNPDVPDYRSALIYTHVDLSICYTRASRLQNAETAALEAVDVGRQLVQNHPQVPDYARRLANAYANLAEVYRVSVRPDEAEQNNLEALKIRQRLVADDPAVPAHVAELAASQINLGTLYHGVLRYDEADAAYQEGIELNEQLVQDHPKVPEYQNNLGVACDNLASMYRDTGRFDESRTIHEKALKIRQRLVDDYPEVPDYQNSLAATHNNIGFVELSKGRHRESEIAFKQALQLYRQLVQSHPRVPDYQGLLVLVYNNLGQLYRNSIRLGDATEMAVAAEQISQRLVQEHPDVAGYQNHLASAYLSRAEACRLSGRRDEALAAVSLALEVYERLVEKYPDAPAYQNLAAQAHATQAVLYRDLGQLDPCIASYQKGLAIWEGLVERQKESIDYATLLGANYTNLAKIVELKDGSAAALPWYTKAIEVFDAVAKGHPELGAAKVSLHLAYAARATGHSMLQHWPEALADYNHSIELATGAQRVIVVMQRGLTVGQVKLDIRKQTWNGDHAKAADLGQLLAEAAEETSYFFFAARHYALASAAAVEDETLDEEQRPKLKEQYAVQAVVLLEKARAAGYFDSDKRREEVHGHADLAPLKDRDDYRQLLQKVDAQPVGAKATKAEPAKSPASD